MTREIVTCKLIFPHGSVTIEDVQVLLKKYTSEFHINNFCETSEVGANKVSFAVVDVSEEVVSSLYKDELIKDIDCMLDGGLHYHKQAKCSKNDCQCG